MRPFRVFNISLAAKCRLLFGVAVLAILAAALYFPLYQMRLLADEATLARAEAAAGAVLLKVDFSASDWGKAQEQLNELWPMLVKTLALDPHVPLLIRADAAEGFPDRGFVHRSLEELRADVTRPFTHKFQVDDDGNRIVRLAHAVRVDETEPNPGQLKGMIQVEAPMPADLTWPNQFVVVGSGVGAGGLAILVFYLITQGLILSPVRKLRRVAEQVTHGDLDVRAGIRTGDEFEDLAVAFNDMLTHLEANQDELRKLNKSLDTRLGELAETNVALFEANKIKSEFLANVSHELRTPLVSIIGFAELLRDMAANPPTDGTRPARYAGNILTSGRMLLDLINDLLDLAKIEAGKIELHITRLRLGDILERLVDFVTPQTDNKNLCLHCDVEAALPEIDSDAGKVQQILHNLISNAIKFTPAGGEILVVARREGDASISIRVQDSGPGIPAEKQSLIFEQFRQLDASTTREYGGTGLGLTITRELCRMLGGSIRLDPETTSGAAFVVTLPIESPRFAERKLIGLT